MNLMWKGVLSYFLVAIAISCGNHNGQLGIQSVEKPALKVTAVAKNAAEEPSNQPKKKKRKSQLKDTWWDRWIKFCRFFLPIQFFFYLLSGQVVLTTPAPITTLARSTIPNTVSCELFIPGHTYKHERIIPLSLKIPANLFLNGTNVRALFKGFLNEAEEDLKKLSGFGCHIFADRDVDITSSGRNSTFCSKYLSDTRDFFSDIINNITLTMYVRPPHFERLKDSMRKRTREKEYVVERKKKIYRVSNDRRIFLPATLVENEDGVQYFHTWIKIKGHFPEDLEEEKLPLMLFGLKEMLDQFYYSPQSRFREINEKCENDKRDCIKSFRKEGVAILSNRNLRSYCSSPSRVNQAEHWISSAAEFLAFADRLEAVEKIHNYLRKRFLNS
ncbi:MAG: hypothetical protein NQ127_00865 [Candidatus Cardinium sp.]|nr:hypothetical protein [Candidatus Cardinium sp.]